MLQLPKLSWLTTAWIFDIFFQKKNVSLFLFFLSAYGITILVLTLETYFKRYDFLIFVLKPSGPYLTITFQFLQAEICCLSLAWRPLPESLSLIDTTPLKLLESPVCLCCSPSPTNYTIRAQSFILSFKQEDKNKKINWWRIIILGRHCFLTYSTWCPYIICKVFMYYEMFSQSIQETVKYFIRCIHSLMVEF